MKKYFCFFCALTLLLSACVSPAKEEQATPALSYPKAAVELVAPAGAGGGYDLTARSVGQCLLNTGLVSVPLPVSNKPGNGSGVGLDYLAEEPSSDSVLAVFSAPLCLIHLNGSTTRNYWQDTTPIARITMDYGCFAVNADSPFENINQVMDALKENPRSVRIGGTSSVGSMDHIQFLKIAKAAGVKQLDQISYIGYEDGTATAHLLGGHIDLVSVSISDVVGLMESGELRTLAITAKERVGYGIVAEMPTCREQGIDAEFVNWRGLFGPKDMPEYARAFWEETLEQMSQTEEWESICRRYGWTVSYLGGKEFVDYLDQANKEYTELLRDTGLLKVNR